MQIIYIKENNEINLLDKALKKIEIITKDNKTFFYVPISEKTRDRIIRKVARKINKLLYLYNTDIVVLSDHLLKNDLLRNELYSNNIKIINGRKLFRALEYKILEKIYECKDRSLNTAELAILVNDNTNLNTEDILEITPKIKSLNIVTNNISKFNLLEEYLYEELGITIRISNNKKKDLLKSEIILNIDFPEEQINKYALPEKGIIINFNNDIKISSKKFNGVNVRGYKICIPDKEKIEGFSDELIYESMIYKMDLKKAREQIEKDKIRILYLVGNNGYINNIEFK